MSEIRLKSYEFRRERQATWLELERLVAKVERMTAALVRYASLTYGS